MQQQQPALSQTEVKSRAKEFKRHVRHSSLVKQGVNYNERKDLFDESKLKEMSSQEVSKDFINWYSRAIGTSSN